MRLLLCALLSLATIMPGAEVPRQSPEYVVTLPNGQQDLLSRYKGKVVVLEFLLTTCPHCQNTARILTKLQSELGSKGFQAIGVAINENPNVPSFIQRFSVNFPVGTGTRDSAYAFLQQSVMGSFYVPQIVILDRKGVIRGQYSGTDSFIANNEEGNIRAMAEKLLTESAAGTRPIKARRKAS